MEVAELQLIVSDRGVREATRAGERMDSVFSRAQANVISLNQALELTGRVAGTIRQIAAAGINAAAEQQRATAGLNAQLVSQGRYTADLSAKLVDQSSALQRVTVFQDDVVLGAQALLATFPRLGSDVIPRVTVAATDLATAMDTDLATAAYTLGIALNDPAEGLARLSRMGVRFTDDQKAVLQQMVDTGNAAEAQSAILGELESRFGGRAVAAAKVFTGQLKQLDNEFGELLESLGNIIVESGAAEGIFSDVKGELRELTQQVADYASANRDAIDDKIRQFFDDLPGKLSSAADATASIADRTATWMATLQPLMQFVSDHPETAAAIFLGGRMGGLAGAAIGAAGGVGWELGQWVNQKFSTAGHGGNPLFQDFGDNVNQAYLAWRYGETPNQPGGLGEVDTTGTGDEELNRRLRLAKRIARNREALDAMRQAARDDDKNALLFDFGQSTDGDTGGFSSQFGNGGSAFDGDAPDGIVPPPKFGGNGAKKETPEERAAREARETSAAGFADARVTGADARLDVAQAELELFQDRVTLSADLATSEQERSRIMLASEGQQLALARQLDQAATAKLNAEIDALRVKQQVKSITDGEKAALDSQIGALEQQRDLLRESGGHAQEIVDTFARAKAEIAASNEQQARAIRDQVRPLEAAARAIREARELATKPGGEGLTSDVLADYEEQVRAQASGVKSAYDEIIQATEGFGRGISRSLAEATTGARTDWRDFLLGLVTDVNEMLIHKGVTEPIMGFVEGAVLDPMKERFGGGGSGRDFGRDAGNAMWKGTADAASSATDDVVNYLTRDPAAEVPAYIDSLPSIAGGTGGAFEEEATRAGDAFVDAAREYGDEQAGIFNSLQSGLTSMLGGLSSAILGLFNFGGDGFSIGGLFATMGIGAVKGALGGVGGQLGGGGGEGGDVDLSGNIVAHNGAYIIDEFHSGGVAGGLRQGEVPAILEQGELVVDKDTTATLYELFSRRGEVRRYHSGGVIGDDSDDLADRMGDMASRPTRGAAGKRRGADRNGVTVNVTVNNNAQSFDAPTAARLLMEQSGTIETIVERGARKGASLSRALGLRDRGQ